MFHFRTPNIHIYTSAEVEKVRAAARAAAQVRDRIAEAVQPGMSTLEIDNLAGVFIRETGGVSGSLGYRGFPRQICVSVNDEVVHGIGRAERIVAPGDLVKRRGEYRRLFRGHRPHGMRWFPGARGVARGTHARYPGGSCGGN